MAESQNTSPQGWLPGQVILCIETSSRSGSIALRRGDGTVSAVDLDEASSHGSDLLPAIDRLMGAAGGGLAPAALDWIAVGTGPGSYTGLRVGAATALGLSRGADAQLLGVPSLAGMALGGLLPGERGAAVRNAFGGQLYLAAYGRPKDPTAPLIELSAPCCCGPEDALKLMDPCAVWLVDDKALGILGAPSVEARDIRPPAVHARDVLTHAMQEIMADVPTGPETVKPLYLRPFEVKNRRR